MAVAVATGVVIAVAMPVAKVKGALLACVSGPPRKGPLGRRTPSDQPGTYELGQHETAHLWAMWGLLAGLLSPPVVLPLGPPSTFRGVPSCMLIVRMPLRASKDTQAATWKIGLPKSDPNVSPGPLK